jgi:GNAT superfamily N-acetyltransferase
MSEAERIVCWEVLHPGDGVLREARRLYETTQDPAERIPWGWVAEAANRRRRWRPGLWSPHLLLAAPATGPGSVGPVAGFGYGAHVPGFGGYVCYLGVEPAARSRGIGSRLLRLFVPLLQVDAACEGVSLPFVVWESRAPAADATQAERDLWRARLRLFERVGACWVAGLTFWSPSFAPDGADAVPLQLFLVPVDVPAEGFGEQALRAVAAGLLRGVYGRDEGDPLYERTLPADCRPVLRPVAALRDGGP